MVVAPSFLECINIYNPGMRAWLKNKHYVGVETVTKQLFA